VKSSDKIKPVPQKYWISLSDACPVQTIFQTVYCHCAEVRRSGLYGITSVHRWSWRSYLLSIVFRYNLVWRVFDVYAASTTFIFS